MQDNQLTSVFATTFSVAFFAGLILLVRWLFRKIRRNSPQAQNGQSFMNFTFTWKSAAIFVVALFCAGLMNALTESQYAGLGVMIIVIMYLSNKERAEKKKPNWSDDHINRRGSN
jgi:O-antigen/teichoic acid export membrane protein